MERAFSALNSNPRCSSDKMLRAEGPFYTSLGRKPQESTDPTWESRAVSPPYTSLRNPR